MVWWMKPVMFVPLAVLQLLNVFWYYLILRILIRCAALHVRAAFMVC